MSNRFKQIEHIIIMIDEIGKVERAVMCNYTNVISIKTIFSSPASDNQFAISLDGNIEYMSRYPCPKSHLVKLC